MDGSRRSIGRLISEEVPRGTQKRGPVYTRYLLSYGARAKIIRGVIAIPGLIFCIRGKVVNLY